ncbi:hypothetical protein SDC9_99569 [bioreactor metagenome]|uniref:Uncharacterized protein n=1 Tax=bioreactor metagenome TaxID=1076179 RepID=A0A645AIP7_9ZZZZ
MASVCFKSFHQFAYRHGFLLVVAIETVEHTNKSPLRPLVIFRVTGAYFAVPIERESYFIKLFSVSVDVVDGCDSRMLTGLYGVLFGGQTVSIVSHGIENVEALQSFVTSVNIRSNVPQRVSHM